MPAPRRDIVQPLIDRHRGPLVGAVLGAWDDWLTSPYRAVWRCRRSRANFVWEQIIDRAHAAFDTSPDVRILDANETFRFLVEDLVLFRFKKGDDAGLSNNVPTQLALAFHDHLQNLLGLPEVQRVDIVYQLNRLETEIRDLLVVGRDEDLVALVIQPASRWYGRRAAPRADASPRAADATRAAIGPSARSFREPRPKFPGLTVSSEFNPGLLRIARQMRGWSQTQLSRESGVSQANLSKLGKRPDRSH